MPRMARLKLTQQAGWYHLYAKSAGWKDDFPLSDKGATEKMISIIKHYTYAYKCQLAAFCIMGNHYHLVVNFDKPAKLSRKELKEKALIIYPNSKTQIDLWSPKMWKRFEERLFNVSEYMRNIQMAFARWYNRNFGRKGRFWAERFKSTLLESMDAVMDCMLYVDLNPVRAGLVERPEAWKGSSYYLRDMRKDECLMDLGEVLNVKDKRKAYRDYRARLYYRGNVPTKEGDHRIPGTILADEAMRGFTEQGIYLKRMRYFTDGLVVGSEERLREWLEKLREASFYVRRKNPKVQLGGIHLTLREQRNNFYEL